MKKINFSNDRNFVNLGPFSSDHSMNTFQFPFGRTALILLACVAGVIAIMHGAQADAFPIA